MLATRTPRPSQRLVALGSGRDRTTGAIHLKLQQQEYTIMPIEIEYEPNEICVLRIRGVLKQSEFAAKQSALADKIDVGAKPRVLAIVENFEGFERGADWNDFDFLLSHSGEIAKIAIVAEPRWEGTGSRFCWRGSSPRASKILSAGRTCGRTHVADGISSRPPSQTAAPAVLPGDPNRVEVVVAMTVVASDAVNFD